MLISARFRDWELGRGAGPTPLTDAEPVRSIPRSHTCTNAVVTCEIKLFHNYFSPRQRPSEIVLFQRVKTCLKLFQNYFRRLLQLMNIFQHV